MEQYDLDIQNGKQRTVSTGVARRPTGGPGGSPGNPFQQAQPSPHQPGPHQPGPGPMRPGGVGPPGGLPRHNSGGPQQIQRGGPGRPIMGSAPAGGTRPGPNQPLRPLAGTTPAGSGAGFQPPRGGNFNRGGGGPPPGIVSAYDDPGPVVSSYDPSSQPVVSAYDNPSSPVGIVSAYDNPGEVVLPQSPTWTPPPTHQPTHQPEPEAYEPEDESLCRLNNVFQETASQLMDAIYPLSQQTADEHVNEKRKINSQFLDHSKDFLSACNNIGKVIISEKYLPVEKKTIKPVSLGGVIGGEKFIVNSILFKFAIGNEMFSDEVGAKIAGHELKSLVHIWETRVRLSYPLQCVVDYLGFRLIAMLKLPIGRGTLKVGTADAGKSMNWEDAELVEKMTEIGKKLNLAAHTFHGRTIYLPADAEGHVGSDNRRYLIDLSRVFPPNPQQGVQYGHLYQMFRPELVKKIRQTTL